MRRFRRGRGRTSQRKGQASTIGAVLLLGILILIIAFMEETYRVTGDMNQLDLERIQENVSILAAYHNEDRCLFLNITNHGAQISHLIRLWIINWTGNEHLCFPLSVYIEAGSMVTLETGLRLVEGTRYGVRLVTERGNITSYSLKE